MPRDDRGWRVSRADLAGPGLLRQPGVRWLEVPVGYRFRGYAEGKKIRWWETLTILLAFWRYRKP